MCLKFCSHSTVPVALIEDVFYARDKMYGRMKAIMALKRQDSPTDSCKTFTLATTSLPEKLLFHPVQLFPHQHLVLLKNT